jgi:hypothetical protein
LGLGIFDNQTTANSPGDKISNLFAGNLGVGFKMDKWKFALDVWQAMLAKKDTKDNDMLGTEVDLRVTYSVMKNLNLDFVAAYLFAGGATYSGTGDKDPYELGLQFSFSF